MIQKKIVCACVCVCLIAAETSLPEACQLKKTHLGKLGRKISSKYSRVSQPWRDEYFGPDNSSWRGLVLRMPGPLAFLTHSLNRNNQKSLQIFLKGSWMVGEGWDQIHPWLKTIERNPHTFVQCVRSNTLLPWEAVHSHILECSSPMLLEHFRCNRERKKEKRERERDLTQRKKSERFWQSFNLSCC